MLLDGLDEEWRTAREVARRASYPWPQVPHALRRLAGAGLVRVERLPRSGGRTSLVYSAGSTEKLRK